MLLMQQRMNVLLHDRIESDSVESNTHACPPVTQMDATLEYVNDFECIEQGWPTRGSLPSFMRLFFTCCVSCISSLVL